MYVSTIIDQIQANLNRSDATDTLVLRWLNEIQHRICNIDNFSFMEKTTSFSLTANTRSYSISSNIDSKFKEELQLWIEESNKKRILTKVRGVEAESMFIDTTKSSKPTHYWIWSDSVYFYPLPDDSYTVYVKYYAYLDDLTNSDSEPNQLCKYYPNLLIFGATAEGFHYFEMSDKAKEWYEKYRAELEVLLRRERKRLHANIQNPRIRLRLR